MKKLKSLMNYLLKPFCLSTQERLIKKLEELEGKFKLLERKREGWDSGIGAVMDIIVKNIE